jgi:hypothetical protein
MTICIALKAPTGVWIGSDTDCLNGNVWEFCGPKWAQCGKYWIGCAGSLRLLNLINANAGTIAALASFELVVDTIHGLVIGDKWEPEKNPGFVPSYRVEFIVTDGDRIIAAGGSFSFTECPGYAVIGAGTECARGALAVLEDEGRGPSSAIYPAIRITTETVRDCHGKPWTCFVEKTHVGE